MQSSRLIAWERDLRQFLTSAAVVLSTLCGAGVAMAQNGIYDVVINLSSLAAGFANDSETSADFEIGDNAEAGPNQSFTSRYGFNVNADSKGLSRTRSTQSVHEVRFEVRSSRGYSLLVSTGWIGEMIRQADTLECGGTSVALSGVTGEVIAGFGVSSGSLNLPDPPDITVEISEDDQSVILSDVSDATIRVVNAQPIEIHILRFSWSATVSSNTCEAAIRLGASSGATTECPVCSYPGDPPRTQPDDGHFVFVEYVLSDCGNGNLDSGEECDLGTGNGFGACCDVFCKLEPDNMSCTDGLFCTGDDRCASGVCQPLGDPCIGLPACAICNEVSDTCDPCLTPTNTPEATAPATGTPTASAASTATTTAVATATSTAPQTPIASATSTATTMPVATATSTAPTTPVASATSTVSTTPVATATSTAPTTPMASATSTATNTPVEGETATPTTVAAVCVGDCDGNDGVAINELIQAVRIALGESDISSCDAVDADQSGTVAINELVQAVNSALNGCA